jgi:hypothetical protein
LRWTRALALALAASCASAASTRAQGSPNEAAPTQAAPTNNTPAESPAPTDAAPTDAAPTDAAPTDAAPTDAASLEALELVAPSSRPARSPLPEALSVRVEGCPAPPFQIDALAHVLDIELVALGIGEAPASTPVEASAQPPALLTLSLPGCADALRIELQARGQLAVETLRPSDFEGIGRERALALATIERLAPLWARVVEAADRPSPPAAPPPEPLPPPPPAPTRELHVSFGVGFLGAPSYEARLTLTQKIAPALRLDFSAVYATEAGRRILAQVIGPLGTRDISASVHAHAALAHVGLEGRLAEDSAVHLFLASGLAAGVVFADGDLEGELPENQAHLAPSNATAPLVFTSLALGFRVQLGADLLASARIEARYMLLGPTFSAIDLPVIDWTDPGLGVGIGLGYGF